MWHAFLQNLPMSAQRQATSHAQIHRVATMPKASKAAHSFQAAF
jgi:hypothetical protein